VCNPVTVDDIDRLMKDIRERYTESGIGKPLWFETAPDDPRSGMARDRLAGRAGPGRYVWWGRPGAAR
jgi:hypothetical protein